MILLSPFIMLSCLTLSPRSPLSPCKRNIIQWLPRALAFIEVLLNNQWWMHCCMCKYLLYPLIKLFPLTLGPIRPGSPVEPGSPLIPWAAMLGSPFSPCRTYRTKSQLNGVQLITINQTRTITNSVWLISYIFSFMPNVILLIMYWILMFSKLPVSDIFYVSIPYI